MNGGATVRRIHRERRTREDLVRRPQRLRRGSWYSRMGVYRQHGGVMTAALDPAVASGALPMRLPADSAPLPPPPEPRCPHHDQQIRSIPFPLSVASVLGLQRHRNVVVVDGRVGLVVSESHAPEDRSVAFDNFSGYVHFVGTLGSLLARAVRLRQPSLRHWAAASAGNAYAELDRPGLAPSAIIADPSTPSFTTGSFHF